MRLAILFSGGKDSCLALHRAAATDQVVCLITVVPDNPESYLFHTPNLHRTFFKDCLATGGFFNNWVN